MVKKKARFAGLFFVIIILFGCLMKISIDEALRCGQVDLVVPALLQAFAQGLSPYAEALRTVDAAQGRPELLKQLRHKVVHSRPQDPRSWRVATMCDRYLH